MLPSKNEALKPFEKELDKEIPSKYVKPLTYSCEYHSSKQIKTVEDFLTWAYDVLSVVIEVINTDKPTVRVTCFDKKLDGVNFNVKTSSTLYEALMETLPHIKAVKLIEEYDDYYFPEN